MNWSNFIFVLAQTATERSTRQTCQQLVRQVTQSAHSPAGVHTKGALHRPVFVQRCLVVPQNIEARHCNASTPGLLHRMLQIRWQVARVMHIYIVRLAVREQQHMRAGMATQLKAGMA